MLLKAIAWLVPGGSILSVLASVASAILGFFGWLLRTAFDGLTRMLANPTTFVVVILVALVCLAGGIRVGLRWDAHLVRKANDRIEVLEKALAETIAENSQWKGRLDDQQKLAAQAALARETAEKQAAAALARLKRDERLRGPAGPTLKAGPQNAAGPGLFGGLPALPWFGE